MEHQLDSPSQSEDSTQLPIQSLTQQRSVSKHESDSKPKNFTLDSSSKKNIGPQFMKIQPNSIPDTAPSSIARSSLTEHYFQNHTIEQWDGPKYETYGSKEVRLRSFIIHDWPHVLEPAPSDLSDAGFFFTVKIRTLF
jgi:hypothetical protein